jgi:hypothetical protein
MMEKEKLKIASIAICEMRGQDPYEYVSYSEDSRDLVLRKRHRWIDVSGEIEARLQKEKEMKVIKTILGE